MIEIKNFSKSYKKGVLAVDDLSLTIEDGDIYGFIGHNGAGKSTTIKAIVGILSIEEGSISINGSDVSKNPIECKKQMAYIPDNPDLYEHLTGIQYLNFICDIFKVDSKTRSIQIEKYSKMYQIENDLSRQIKGYSHGMKQKIAIIASLCHNPKVVIMDEPFVGLDPVASHTTKQIMKELASEGVSIFFSSHVLEVVEKLCNKVAVIKGGKLIVSGDINEVNKNGNLEQLFMEIYK
ncbi:MAG: ABC transporter ATP-binding protein [Anaeroplasmataceae bacterium]